IAFVGERRACPLPISGGCIVVIRTEIGSTDFAAGSIALSLAASFASSSFITVGVGFPLRNENVQKPVLMAAAASLRARGAIAANRVAVEAARSTMRSFNSLSERRSFPSSNQPATARLDKSTAAAVTTINWIPSVRGHSLIEIPDREQRYSRRPTRS